ncbi:MAG: type III secretion protein [Spartobacteria bacterium]|nr:type III secretion protein [Spartobacteria bacterium]
MEIQFGIFPQVFLLVFFRVAAIALGTVFLGGNAVPKQVRVALAMALTIALLPMVPDEWILAAGKVTTVPDVILALMGEIFLGLSVGLICDTMVSLCVIGGEVIGLQSAMSMARELDPTSGVENPVFSILMQKAFVLIVLLSGGHLVLIRMVGQSFYAVPPQLTWMSMDVVTAIISLGSVMYEWGLRLAAPVLGAAMILNVAMGLMARLAPNFNILFLSLPIRVFVGISCIGLILRFGGAFFSTIIDLMMAACNAVLTGAG